MATTEPIKQEALALRMKRWRIKNDFRIQDAASKCGCENKAWLAWEEGAPISEPWRKQIERTLKKSLPGAGTPMQAKDD